MFTKTLLAAAFALAATTAPAGAAPTPPLFDAHGCWSTLHVFGDSTGRLQPRYVPQEYKPLGWVPGEPYIALWSFSCDALSVDGGSTHPTQLGIAAVAIEHPDRQPSEQQPVELPNLWSHYVHVFETDNPTLASALRREGFPARLARGMSFQHRDTFALPAPLLPIAEARIDVPGAWSSWTEPVIQQEPAHSHANEFWSDTPQGPSVLNVRIPEARDHFCELAAGERCGTADVPAGSDMAAFLGATHRSADAAVDHAKIKRVLGFSSSR